MSAVLFTGQSDVKITHLQFEKAWQQLGVIVGSVGMITLDLSYERQSIDARGQEVLAAAHFTNSHGKSLPNDTETSSGRNFIIGLTQSTLNNISAAQVQRRTRVKTSPVIEKLTDRYLIVKAKRGKPRSSHPSC
jgi:hypothetical protein